MIEYLVINGLIPVIVIGCAIMMIIEIHTTRKIKKMTEEDIEFLNEIGNVLKKEKDESKRL